MRIDEFVHICDELATFYGGLGYTDPQMKRLYDRLKYCTVSEIKAAVDHMTTTEMKFPNMVQFLAHTRTAQADAIERRKADLIRSQGVCHWCHSTGMVIVWDSRSDGLKREVSLRCGECDMAEVSGVLKHQPFWRRETHRTLEPTILEKTWTANPTEGRLKEIKAMPKEKIAELLVAEPWLKWPILLFANKSIPIKPVNKHEEFGDDEWE